MDNYTLNYKGNIVSLLRNLNISSYEDFLALELDLLETLRYEEIIEKNSHLSKNKQDDQLINIIIKVANVKMCQFAFSQMIESDYQLKLPKMYCDLFERSPEFTQEVLVYLIKNYTKDELLPQVEANNSASFLNKAKTHAEFTLHVDRHNDEHMWINREPNTILDTFKLLNDHLGDEPKTLYVKSLIKKYEEQANTQQTQKFFKAIIDFIIENDYELDFKIAPEFLCQCYQLENIKDLFNHINRAPDFKEDLLVYIAKIFKQSEEVSSELKHTLYYSNNENDEGVSFLEDKKFIKLITSNDFYPEFIHEMSLELLVKTHFDFILQDKEKFDDELITCLKPNDSLKNYLQCLDYEDKKKLLLSLSKEEKFHPLINEMYASVLDSFLFDKYFKNVNVSYTIEYKYTDEQKKENIKNILQLVSSLPIGFQDYVNEKLNHKLSQMDEKNEQQYLEIFLNQENKQSKKLKI